MGYFSKVVVDIKMRPREKQLIDKRLKDFIEEVLPVDLFPYLPCLFQGDKEEIQAVQTNHGPMKATQTLVDRLKRRDKGFANFVQALRKCGGAHTALLLDPYYMINGWYCLYNWQRFRAKVINRKRTFRI